MSLGKLDLTNIGQQRAENPDHGPSTEMGNRCGAAAAGRPRARAARGLSPSRSSFLVRRRQKLLEFESQCNKVDEGLYVSSELVAKNRELLRLAGITHVVNTIGFICPNMFPDELSYLLINILDSPQEDILVRAWNMAPMLAHTLTNPLAAPGSCSRALTDHLAAFAPCARVPAWHNQPPSRALHPAARPLRRV